MVAFFSRTSQCGHSLFVLGLWEFTALAHFKSGRARPRQTSLVACPLSSYNSPPVPLRIPLQLFLPSPHAMLSSVTTANMNAYSEVAAISYADHTTVQGFVLAPEDTWPPQIYTEMHPGPWGWQWKDGVRDLVLVPPSPTRITIKALMGDIKKVGMFGGACVSFTADMDI